MERSLPELEALNKDPNYTLTPAERQRLNRLRKRRRAVPEVRHDPRVPKHNPKLPEEADERADERAY